MYCGCSCKTSARKSEHARVFAAHHGHACQPQTGVDRCLRILSSRSSAMPSTLRSSCSRADTKVDSRDRAKATASPAGQQDAAKSKIRIRARRVMGRTQRQLSLNGCANASTIRSGVNSPRATTKSLVIRQRHRPCGIGIGHQPDVDDRPRCLAEKSFVVCPMLRRKSSHWPVR